MNEETATRNWALIAASHSSRRELRMNSINEVFGDSYERCLKQGDFFNRFYDSFIASDALIAEKFAHTDMDEQKSMVKASLHMIMALRSLGPEKAVQYFKKIGTAHGRQQYNIDPEMYEVWEDCLLEAVKHCDEQYDAEIDAAWRELLEDGIRIMKSMY